MDSRELAKIACHALDERKAENITVIDIRELSVIADYFVIADGENQKGFEAGKKFSDWDCKQISLDLSVARQYRTSTALDLVKKSASVVIKGGVGEVTLKASESGKLTLYDLSGRIVSEASMSTGSVSVRRGVYLASFKSFDGVSSVHVIVK